MKLFCFGFGYCASYFARELPWESVSGTHRGDFPLNEELRRKLQEATHVLVSIPPNAEGDFVLAQKLEMNPEWVGYLGTTGVYGNYDGGWVDESFPVNPPNARSEWRVKSENEWLATKLPVHIFRLSGIYGLGRSVIDDLHEGTARRVIKENQYFSRIHVEDVAQILAASVKKPTPGEIYNCADDLPAPAAEVVEYAARLIGVEPPPAVPYEKAELSEMARSFYMSSRRMNNDKIKEKLGVSLRYPNYREGLDAIWHASR